MQMLKGSGGCGDKNLCENFRVSHVTSKAVSEAGCIFFKKNSPAPQAGVSGCGQQSVTGRSKSKLRLFRNSPRQKTHTCKHYFFSRMKTESSEPVATASAVVTAQYHEMSTLLFAIAVVCGIWYFFILLVQAIGFTQLYVMWHGNAGNLSDLTLS